MNSGAGNETRTRDPDLGKVVLYQLSYSRIEAADDSRSDPGMNSPIRALTALSPPTRNFSGSNLWK